MAVHRAPRGHSEAIERYDIAGLRSPAGIRTGRGELEVIVSRLHECYHCAPSPPGADLDLPEFAGGRLRGEVKGGKGEHS